MEEKSPTLESFVFLVIPESEMLEASRVWIETSVVLAFNSLMPFTRSISHKKTLLKTLTISRYTEKLGGRTKMQNG